MLGRNFSEIIASGQLTRGKWIERFEFEFARMTGARYAIAVSSGTAALEILLRWYQVGNQEVIVPTNTFLASANAVVFAGGTPILADTGNFSLVPGVREIQSRISKKTVGIMVVHIGGTVQDDFSEIRTFAKENGFFLIEDAAHAPGASLEQVRAGNLADGGAFSFFPSKPLTTCEGGMITTNDEKCAEFARSIRCHGIATSAEKTSTNRNSLFRLGHNWRMSEVHALIGVCQLSRLEEALQSRRQCAMWYNKILKGEERVQIPSATRAEESSWYKYPVFLPKKHSRQDTIKRLFDEFQIASGSLYWPPCHLQPFYQERFGCRPGDCPNAEEILDRTIALPIYPELAYNQIEYIAQSLMNILNKS